MPEQALLITQSLQNDFVSRIRRFDSLPNLLHIGAEESRRLLGEESMAGPVAQVMGWAYAQMPEALKIVHIRDWHDPSDPFQHSHLERFGLHCIQNSAGADFAFDLPDDSESRARTTIINSLTLNDFERTNLVETLAPLADSELRVGIMGVWTDAKVTFLAYELSTRFPRWQIGICSALTASSSRSRHFFALEQLKNILGVNVFSAIGQFVSFLSNKHAELPIPVPAYHERPEVVLPENTLLPLQDMELLRFLFRNCSKVICRPLDGGFSGNAVFGTESVDLHGHIEVGHVVKIGPVESVGRERSSFEQIESVLGNAAPRIVEFSDRGSRGALKYRYASMDGGFSTTFQKTYMSGSPISKIEHILETVFKEQLGKLYSAAEHDRCDLLKHYCFSPHWAPNVRMRIKSIFGSEAESEELEIAPGIFVPNIAHFYEKVLPKIRLPQVSHYFSFVHGDLNGANIIIDGRENVWIIDFFHTARGHVLKDLIKLENDILYIFTAIRDADELLQAVKLSDVILSTSDLASGIPQISEAVTNSALVRAYETIKILRSFYPNLVRTDRDPLQLFIGQLRYAVHTLSFDESSAMQKRWALYTAGKLGAAIESMLDERRVLRVDWIVDPRISNGALGITILPGRKDHGRDHSQDLTELQRQGVHEVVSLCLESELEHFGVADLLREYRDYGFVVHRLPIPDQGVPSSYEMERLLMRIDFSLKKDRRIVVHCVGGLGRSGTVAACYLKSLGSTTDEAVRVIRSCRSSRAIESDDQFDFVTAWSFGFKGV